ncbi:MAG TPA: hypothetical protein VN736_13360 [Candidatus Limnocylindrales bacterium]|nr:hypothetical protein [Candidatus Limnocylindrales bacterium]
MNFGFWFERAPYLWMPVPIATYAGVLGVAALLIVGLFFAGPAFASHTARRPLWEIAEHSFGSVPVWAIRLCCIWFVVTWIADLVSWPASRFFTPIVGRDSSGVEAGAIAGAVVIFLFVTGLQSFRTNARLALFTNKLGIAILVAALLRVREGLPAALQGTPASDGNLRFLVAAHGLSLLALYVGPLIFLAADFGYRMEGRRQIAMAGAVGLVLPLFGTLLLVGAISSATLASPYYQPSLEPTVAMALWSKVAGSALPGRMAIAAITMFGAGRFGAKALTNALAVRSLGRRPQQVLLAGLCAVIACCSLDPFNAGLTASSHAAAACLTVTAAVLTGDFLSGQLRGDKLRRIDWVASTALVIGLATFFLVRSRVSDAWWEPGLLPSYAIAFITCALGRRVQRGSDAQAAHAPQGNTRLSL